MALYNLQGKNALGQMVFWDSTTIDFAGNDAPEPVTDIALLFSPDPNAISGVASVFGRTGIIVAQFGDYDTDEVQNTSSVPGATVSDALNYLELNANLPAWSKTLEIDNRSDGYDLVLTKNSSITTENKVGSNSDNLLLTTGTSSLTAGSINIISGGAAQNGGAVQIRGGGSSLNTGGIQITSEYGGQNTGSVKIGTGSYGTTSTGSLTLNSGFNGKATGDIHILAGYEWSQPDSYSNKGTIRIKSADALNTMANGGDGYFIAGDGNGSVVGNAGNITLKAGSMLSGTGNGGYAFLQAGTGRGTTKQGGNLEIKAGSGLSNALGGSLSIEAGSAQNANAGNLTIKSGGISGGTGRSGDILIQAGSSVGQPGGDILITGSNSISANSGNIYIRTPQNLTNAGGDIEIATGGGSVGGDLRLIAGREPLSTPGKITLQTGDLFVWPDQDGTANQVLKTDGNGNLSFGNSVSSSGSADYVQRADGSGGFIGTSDFKFVNTSATGLNELSISAGTPTVSGDPTAKISLKNNSTSEVFGISYNQTEDTTTIKATGTSSISIDGGGGGLQWPKTNGSTGQILSVTAPGVMGWIDPDALASVTGISTLNTNETPFLTTGNDQDTGVIVDADPNPNGLGTDEGFITVFVNGIQYNPGDGTNVGVPCYFRDSIGNIRTLDNVQQSDILYWNGNVAGFDLDAQDKITLVYSVTDKAASVQSDSTIATELISSKTIQSTNVAGTGFSVGSVEVLNASGFSAGDLIYISGARNPANNGYRAISNVTGNIISIKNSPNNPSVLKNFFVPDSLVSGSVSKVHLSSIRNSNSTVLEMTVQQKNDNTLWVWTPLGTNLIGDIRTSILTESQFNSVQGFGWVLADGRSVAGSPYSALTGNANVPDLRGQFLRGKNYTRADAYQDLNGNSAEGTQRAFKTAMPSAGWSIAQGGAHSHTENTAGAYNTPVLTSQTLNTGTLPPTQSFAIWDGSTQSVGAHSHVINTSSTHNHNISGGDIETSPNHVVVNYFIYIGA